MRFAFVSKVQTVIDTIAGLMGKNPDDVALYFQNTKLAVDKVRMVTDLTLWSHISLFVVLSVSAACCPKKRVTTQLSRIPWWLFPCHWTFSDAGGVPHQCER
jgi:hypothetical protein